MTVEQKAAYIREIYLRTKGKDAARLRERQRIYRQRTAGKPREYKQRSYEKFKDRERAQALVRRNRDPEKHRQAKKAWAALHPDAFQVYEARRRAKKIGVGEHFSRQKRKCVRDQFNNQCFRCGSTENLNIDHHIPLSAGAPLEYGNAVCLCRRCNRQKGSQMPKDFYLHKEMILLAYYLSEQRAWIKPKQDKSVTP